jgi:hypothetical protein
MQNLLRSNAKYKVYKTHTKPVILYCSESWTLVKINEDTLKIFERKILRKI